MHFLSFSLQPYTIVFFNLLYIGYIYYKTPKSLFDAGSIISLAVIIASLNLNTFISYQLVPSSAFYFFGYAFASFSIINTLFPPKTLELLFDEYIVKENINLDNYTYFVKLYKLFGIDTYKVDYSNQRDKNSLFFKAILENHRTLIKQLIAKHDVDPNQTNSQGDTALIIAIRRRNIEAAEFLLLELKVDPNKLNPLIDALMRTINHKELVEILLKAGANPDQKNDIGSTALMIAIYNKQTDVAKLLLEAGANINHVNNHGHTALTLTLLTPGGRHTAELKLLLSHNPNIEYAKKMPHSDESYTALKLADLNCCREGFMALIEAGANPLKCLPLSDYPSYDPRGAPPPYNAYGYKVITSGIVHKEMQGMQLSSEEKSFKISQKFDHEFALHITTILNKPDIKEGVNTNNLEITFIASQDTTQTPPTLAITNLDQNNQQESKSYISQEQIYSIAGSLTGAFVISPFIHAVRDTINGKNKNFYISEYYEAIFTTDNIINFSLSITLPAIVQTVSYFTGFQIEIPGYSKHQSSYAMSTFLASAPETFMLIGDLAFYDWSKLNVVEPDL